MRVALGVEYDGSRFCGWQSQPSGCAVQDVLARAVAAIAGHPVKLVAAGRTDAGVHALAQVVHFDTDSLRPDTAWVRGVNALLPASVAVRWARPVEAGFHARFSARSRRYRYLLLNRPTRPGLLAGRVGWYHAVLDVAAMVEAAQCLLGEQDFSAFRAAECQARSPVRTLTRLDIHKAGDLVVFDFAANAFLHHMVRNMVGCLVYVGAGKQPPAWLRQVLAGRDRRQAAPTFAPDGLYFAGAEYDAQWALPLACDPSPIALAMES
ncbi:tRNA pseudouridine(38-40) synthase TruA [Thiobacter aerophilum]|uniref:tRNA pseudouridine synthase A n=1 Tax=Thiobacter aerophilum TaxID=3121275 RepID=A0ABV0EI99_9BURK